MSSPAILQGGYVLPVSRSFTQMLLDIVGSLLRSARTNPAFSVFHTP